MDEVKAAPGQVRRRQSSFRMTPQNNVYPLARRPLQDTDEVYVGRSPHGTILSVENGINLWVVADNIRKGAATNAVQIAELLLDR